MMWNTRLQQKEENRIAVPAKYLMTKLIALMHTVLTKSQGTIDNISAGNENPENETA